tara:strand:- start:54498 stop:58508 length:4011 start_codon:yes stop_codon:yes gene_type:complete
MEKKIIYTYKGASQDVIKSKHTIEYYFEAQHIKVLATNDQSTGGVSNEKGNTKVITIPSISINATTNVITYGSKTLSYTNNTEVDTQVANGLLPTSSSTQKIISTVTTRTGLVIFTTDDLGMDCIWYIENLVNNDYSIELIYIRNLNFSTQYPIQSIFNYENENIQKVYWVDGKEQIRFINLKHNLIEGNSPLIDLSSTSINFVGKVTFSQPKINTVVGGGSHTSGMVQYAYNLYKLNSSQTKISPLSKLVPLDKGENNGGGELNEIVGSTPVVTIEDIDTTYTHIKIYAIKYTSYNQIPSVSLIDERELSSDSVTLYDDGTIIESLSLSEFLFLGSDPIYPKHIQAKDNRLFPVNIQSKPFIIPDEFDFRAYSFLPNETITKVFQDDIVTYIDGNFNLPKKHDAINKRYDTYKYQYNSTVYGGEGKLLKYEIVNKNVTNPEDKRFFKDREIYRIGIEFYNNLGQTSLPNWIADFKSSEGNLNNLFNTLKVTLKPAFYTLLNNHVFDNESNRPVGYRIIRAERTAKDKTILAQGMLTPMIFQVLGNEASDNDQFRSSIIRQNFQDQKIKMPSYLTREFQKVPNNVGTGKSENNGVLQEVKHLEWLSDSDGDEGGEIFTTVPNDKISQTFQYTKMMQMYCPEVLFQNDINFTTDLVISPIGLAQSTLNGVKAEERYIDTKLPKYYGKTLGGINPWWVNSNQYIEDNKFTWVFDVPERGATNNNHAFIGPSGSNETIDFKQYYRQFNTYIDNPGVGEYPIYNVPELTTRGLDSKEYANNPIYTYSNSLEGFISDGDDACNECPPINSMNNYNADCITVMLGDANTPTNQRVGLETLYASANIVDKNGVLICEIRKPSSLLYTSNIYGGNSYEDKKRTNYIGIGDYNDINNNVIEIDSPGDTFVQKFRFLRINKTEVETYDTRKTQMSEIVEYYTETTIDLKNRNDISLSSWDSKFQPQYTEYHKYNTVYSQNSNLVKNTDVDYTYNRIKNYDTRIQSTKLKIPNESIDSWTDILENETMDLDGRFGPINNIIEFKGNLFTFQDEAIANISINPRVQVTSDSGVSIELGKGGILYDYDYITTKSGSINKWGIVSTKKGIYYYDALNKSIGRVPDMVNQSLSDMKGMHAYFNNNYNYNLIKEDNPILKQGVLFGYDAYNKDIYFTLHQGDDSFTWCYNEERDQFIDLKKYYPSNYIYKGGKLLLSSNGSDLYESYTGEYNKYFDTYIPSYIILQLNPESSIDTIFNTIHYNSELYLNDVDQPNKTLTHIQAYNEYQDSGRIPLIVGRDKNLRRKFREWKALIPRMGRNRIRNPWIYLKLELDNTSNYKLILHDIIINYSI